MSIASAVFLLIRVDPSAVDHDGEHAAGERERRAAPDDEVGVLPRGERADAVVQAEERRPGSRSSRRGRRRSPGRAGRRSGRPGAGWPSRCPPRDWKPKGTPRLASDLREVDRLAVRPTDEVRADDHGHALSASRSVSAEGVLGAEQDGVELEFVAEELRRRPRSRRADRPRPGPGSRWRTGPGRVRASRPCSAPSGGFGFLGELRPRLGILVASGFVGLLPSRRPRSASSPPCASSSPRPCFDPRRPSAVRRRRSLDPVGFVSSSSSDFFLASSASSLASSAFFSASRRALASSYSFFFASYSARSARVLVPGIGVGLAAAEGRAEAGDGGGEVAAELEADGGRIAEDGRLVAELEGDDRRRRGLAGAGQDGGDPPRRATATAGSPETSRSPSFVSSETFVRDGPRGSPVLVVVASDDDRERAER